MITQQRMRFEDDGTIRLRNTYDVSGAMNKAKEYNENGLGYGKNGYCLGFIPEEMKMHDPWLKEAYRALREGNRAKYTDYMLKFFRVHSALAINRRKVCWRGCYVPILDKTPTPKRPDAVEQLLRADT